MSNVPKVGALAPFFGTNRMLAEQVGVALGDRNHVTVLFGGGMCELPYILARTLIVSDLHRHVINLSQVLRDDKLGPRLIRAVRRVTFHEDSLKGAQEFCRSWEADPLSPAADFHAAVNYFTCAWMTRSGSAGTSGEFKAGLSTRWNAAGGDSVVRFRSAGEALLDWRNVVERCTFVCMDAFEMLKKVKDEADSGIYSDPPFPQVGKNYKHNCGKKEADELAWHMRLRDALVGFKKCRVVCRFYRHEMIERLYPTALWEWREFKGRTQTNADAPEILLINKLGGAV